MRTPAILRGLRALGRDRRGVSAVEFALIAPIMILMYFGMAELTQGMMAQRRVAHAASAVGDLVAQDDQIMTTEKTDIFAAADNIVRPFPTVPLKLRVTSITGNAQGQPRVDWSDGESGLAAYAHCGVVPDLPAGLIAAPGDNVIMAEAIYAYTSPVAQVLPNGLDFSERFFLRPRKVPRIVREGAQTTPC